MNFSYRGTIPASKSIMNRALICSSYDQNLILRGDSSCDDVEKMKNCIKLLLFSNSAQPNAHSQSASYSPVYDCGAAGTVFRFLALRLSRIPGQHILKGTKRLLARPQQDLMDLLTRLGVQGQLTEESLLITSSGWQNLDQPIVVKRSVSSQFASALILNAWNLNKDLIIEQEGNPISEGYLEMTLNLVKSLGMTIEVQSHPSPLLKIKAHSSIKVKDYQVESDLSSAFAVAAFAALNGKAVFENFPTPSLQPDVEFVSILKEMGVTISSTKSMPEQYNSYLLEISKPTLLNGTKANLKSAPDLFPVLATLCAFANAPSVLYGAPQLIHKESNRIDKTAELLEKIGVQVEKRDDGMVIHPPPKKNVVPFVYDTDHDHRLAFAAALVKSQGFPITIQHPEVVSKSFPEFWDTVKV